MPGTRGTMRNVLYTLKVFDDLVLSFVHLFGTFVLSSARRPQSLTMLHLSRSNTSLATRAATTFKARSTFPTPIEIRNRPVVHHATSIIEHAGRKGRSLLLRLLLYAFLFYL